MSAERSDRFPTTAWSLIRAAQHQDQSAYVAAMNRFMEGYWRPVFRFLRVHGHSHHQAEDLTQEFFYRLLKYDWIRRATPERGRFRNFLLTVVKRFVSDVQTDRAPRQRRFDDQLIAVSTLVGESDRTFEPPANQTPEDVFMRQWAQSVIDNCVTRLEAWCREKGHVIWHEIFMEVHFPAPGTRRVSQQALARRRQLSRDQVRYALDQTNRQFVELLRAEVTDQVGSNDEIDAEITDLERLLSVPPPK